MEIIYRGAVVILLAIIAWNTYISASSFSSYEDSILTSRGMSTIPKTDRVTSTVCVMEYGDTPEPKPEEVP